MALTTFSDLVAEARERVKRDGLAAGLPNGNPLDSGGIGSIAYADAVGLYLAFAVDRMANTLCTIARWTPERQQTVTAFARQAIPMTWDFPDVNPFASAAGDYAVSVEGVIKGISSTTEPPGFARQADASTQNISRDKIISTDPPYYDNVPYADLSDFFYVWLRCSLRSVFPNLFATLVVPKAEELVAFAHRHDKGKAGAEAFFLDGMTQAMHRIAEYAHPSFPVTIYYAFKQSENDSDAGTASTGWETFLDAVVRAGFATSGTWPMRTELGNRMRGMASNALASSIVLVCRQRSTNATLATRSDFLRALKLELPQALKRLQQGNIAPVDLAQASIGPGMAIYSQFSKVLEPDDTTMSVRTALKLINQVLDETLAEQEGEYDEDTRWALAWFEEYGFSEGPYGRAEQLSRAKNTSIQGLEKAGVITAKSGKTRLLTNDELSEGWDPLKDDRLTVWEALHHLIRILHKVGEVKTGQLLAAIQQKNGSVADAVRDLCYRLYSICEKKKWAKEALEYNGIITTWADISKVAENAAPVIIIQDSLFDSSSAS